MSTHLTALIRKARHAIADLQVAIAEGFDDEMIEEFGDIADDLIDEVSALDIAAGARLSASIATLAA